MDEHLMVVETIKWCFTNKGWLDRLTGGLETIEKVPNSDYLS